MMSLLDQSALTALAERLVDAARRAGADAADAIAVRSVSQSVEVRDGQVEESERSESDDVGLRVLVGQRQAVVSTNDIAGDGAATLAERAVAMARVAPEDEFAGLADPARLARDIPDLDLLDPVMPDVARLEELALAAEAAALAVKGVTKSGGAGAATGIGGMVLVTSHGFSGAYLGSSHSVSMTAIAGEGTGMERDYDYRSVVHAADLDDPAKVGRIAGERAVARLNPRKVETRKRAGRLRSAHRRRYRVASRRRDQRRRRSRARQASCRTSSASACSRPASVSSTIRCASAACARGPSMAKAWPAGRSRSSRTAC